MTIVTIKGHHINTQTVKNTTYRKAVQFENTIREILRTIGVNPDDVQVSMEKVMIKKAPAFASWYFQDQYMYFSAKIGKNFIENLLIVTKVIEYEVEALLQETKTLEAFCAEFSEDHDVEEKRVQARETLGVDLNCIDIDEINKKYKLLAKQHHPDTETGSTEMFKKINVAHKILKRELV